MRSFTRPDGCRLVFETHGDPSDPALLLLEGSGGDIPGWGRNVTRLADGDLFVIVYDQRGNGWSDARGEPWTMQTFVDDALALLDHLQVDRAHLYGQSFGGMVALELLSSTPHRVRTAVLAATHAGGASVVRPRSRVPKDQADMAIFAESFVAQHPDDVRALYDVGVPQDPIAGRRQWEAMQGYDVSARLSQVAVPVLILHGDADRVIDVANARLLADGIPGAELVVLEGAGHVYQWEQPAASDAAVLSFIGRNTDA